MSSQLARELWEQQASRFRSLTTETTFLEIDLRQIPDAEQFDGSQFSELMAAWLPSQKLKHGFLLLHRQRQVHWLPAPVTQEYQELLQFSPEQTPSLRGCVWKDSQSASEIQAMIQTSAESALSAIAQRHQAAILSPQQPVGLDVIQIRKPWGYEGWYTGVEKRGVATVSDACGVTELPYALALFRSAFLADHPEQLILLKTLNPVREEVLGDLYLEMHEQKWEVYVVIEIDPLAWSAGTALIKAGLRQETIERFQRQHGKEWERACLGAFREAIENYEVIRRRIDHLLDEQKKASGIDNEAVILPDQMQWLLAKVPDDLRKTERKLWEKANDFVGEHPVKIGDVFTFPVYQIHALQHGVRVIEFQTPHYDRLIVMYGQKVLTQSSWDTRQALALTKPESYQPPKLRLLEQTDSVRNERFVDFPAFTADRLTLQPGAIYDDQTESCYHLLIVVTGEAVLQMSHGYRKTLRTEESMFIPVAARKYAVQNSGKEPLVYLKAMPRQT